MLKNSRTFRQNNILVDITTYLAIIHFFFFAFWTISWNAAINTWSLEFEDQRVCLVKPRGCSAQLLGVLVSTRHCCSSRPAPFILYKYFSCCYPYCFTLLIPSHSVEAGIRTILIKSSSQSSVYSRPIAKKGVPYSPRPILSA